MNRREEKSSIADYRVAPGTQVKLKNHPSDAKSGSDKQEAQGEIDRNVAEIGELAYRLYAENRRALLLVLQGIDTAGKDGVIRTVLNGINPQVCQISSFVQPSHEELDHDFLWRIHRSAPRRGNVGIFNRSHYEDVLVVRVHNLVPPEVWKPRYDRINEFEQMLVDGGTTLVKCFLHISRDEQKQRLEERLADPTKRWKFKVGDLEERKFWDDYVTAYEEALSRCSTKHAPWHIIPADRKWHRDLVISRILCQTLRDMDPQFPPPDPELDGVHVE